MFPCMPQEDNFRRMMILIDIPFPNCCSLSLLLHLFVLPLLGNARARNTLMLCALGNIIILPHEINSRTMAFEYLKLQRVLIIRKFFVGGDSCTFVPAAVDGLLWDMVGAELRLRWWLLHGCAGDYYGLLGPRHPRSAATALSLQGGKCQND